MLVKMVQHYGLMAKKPLRKSKEYNLDEATAKAVIAQKAGKKTKKG